MKSLTNFLTESKKDWVEVPEEIGSNGFLLDYPSNEIETYKEMAKYGDILADAYIERFGERIGKSSRDIEKFYRNISTMIPNNYSLDYFAKTVAKCYALAKLEGVDEKDIIPVTIGLTNVNYNLDTGAGYMIDPITCKWKELKMNYGRPSGEVKSWCFYPDDFDDVKRWIKDIAPYSKAVVE